jgi:Na+/H+-dicarboxylate symporter
MVRTAVNVTGDATVSLIVAKSEKQFDQYVFDDPKADQHSDENPGVVPSI